MKKNHTKSSRKKIVGREEKERQLAFKKLYPKKKPYPNATITEIKKNAVDAGESPYGPRKVYKKYKKGNYLYMITDKVIQALYIPSWKKQLKIMFEWKPKKKKWELLTYREGER